VRGHGSPRYVRPPAAETPREGNLRLPISWRRILAPGDAPRLGQRYAREAVERPSPTLADAALAALAFAATLLLLSSGLPIAPSSRPLDALSLALAAGSTLPVALSRRAPLTVFVLTALASTALALLGHRQGIAVGPAVALY
jgi:hypothetical protein